MNIPLYQVIINDILEKIESGFYASGSQLPSEKEISEQFNVSRITSKRALNELEKMKVIKRIQGKGSFVLKTHPTELQGQTFIFLMPFPNEPTFGDYTTGILEELEKHGMNLQIKDTSHLNESFFDNINQYAGVLYYPRNNEEAMELTSYFLYKDIPCVFLDKKLPGFPYSSVSSNNTQGAFEATKHLIENGSKQIKFITSSKIEDFSSVMERYLGYVKALREYNLEFNYYKDIIVVNDQLAIEAALLDFHHKTHCDGLVCENDLLAINIINKTKQLKLPPIPLIGFDNIQAATMISPSLTTIQQDFKTIGNTATRMLIDSITNPNHKLEDIKINTKLIIRNSSKRSIK